VIKLRQAFTGHNVALTGAFAEQQQSLTADQLQSNLLGLLCQTEFLFTIVGAVTTDKLLQQILQCIRV